MDCKRSEEESALSISKKNTPKGKHAKTVSNETETMKDAFPVEDASESTGQEEAPNPAPRVAEPGDTSVLPADTVFGEGAYGPMPTMPGNFASPQPGAMAQAKPKRSAGKIAAIVIGVILAVLAVVYVAGAIFFMGRFMPNTHVGGMDLSLRPISDVKQDIDQTISNYELSVEGQGFALDLSSEDTGIVVDSQAIVESMHQDTSPWAWPVELFKDHDETDKLAASYNQSGLDALVRAAIDEFNASATAPVNATIAFSEADGAFVVQPEQAGTMLNADYVIQAIDAAVITVQSSVELTEEALIQPTVLSTEPKLQTAADQANTMIAADVTLTLAGNSAAELDAAQISQWIALGEDLSVSLNQEALTAWVDELAAKYDTVGSERTYTRPDGKKITVSGGSYGWKVDRDALLAQVQEAVSAGTVATQEIPCSSKAAVFNGKGAQDWSGRYVDIDLTEQHVRFYDGNGSIIWESDCVSGRPDGDRDTPTGINKLNAKQSPSTLIGYKDGKKTYETPVSYWMPFIRNSVGLHDATWQSSFGGDRYKTHGSHGCINLPLSKAKELYGLIKVGDVVITHF